MHRLIRAALLLVLLIVAVHGSRNHLARSHLRNIRDLQRNEAIAKRQEFNCTSLDHYPESCAAALDNIDLNSGSENLENALDDFCTPECVQPYVDYYNCLGYPEQVTNYNNLICGKNGNR